MARELRAYAVRAGKTGPITFLASTEGLARDGLIIDQTGWELAAYRANPVLLWAHRYDMPPIGKTTRLEVTDKGLVADVVFDEADEFAAAISRKVREGYLNASSVGWDSKEIVGNRVVKQELLDISIVPVPGDAGALAMARSHFRALARADDTLTADEGERLIRRLHEELVVIPRVKELITQEVDKWLAKQR